MSTSELINEILSEWAYRVENGMPDTKNPIHLQELSNVLNEMGLSSVKNELLESLREAGKSFTNPVLNKEIPYKATDGTQKKGIVGNLLRLPKEHPGRVAAEKMLPPDAAGKKAAMKDLGSEKDGHSTTPKPKKDGEETKDGEGGEAGNAEAEKQKATQAMFQDPTYVSARLDAEKDAAEKLAKSDADKGEDGGTFGTDEKDKAENPSEETPNFKPVEPEEITKEMPEADTAVFNQDSDIEQISPQERHTISTKIDELAKLADEAKAKGEKAPNYNLCKVTVPGTNLYCDNNLGIPREQMPQFKGKPQPGSPADKMPKDKNGEVDTEEVFKKMLADKGIKTADTEVPADSLKASQSELVGAKVAGMTKALEEDPLNKGITAPIYVSRDGYVIDGHHRWAAVTSKAIKDGKPANMKVHVIDMDAKDIIPMANKFAEDIGVASKKADANAETTPSHKDDEHKNKVIASRIQDKIKGWADEEKEFFKKKVYKGNSPERRSWGEAIKAKGIGAWHAILKGAKHEVEEFKTAGHAVKDLVSGKKLDNHQKKALKAVGIKVATTALFGGLTGGLEHGAAKFALHVAKELIPHTVGETIAKGIGKASLFAGAEEEDMYMEKFINAISKKMADMDITPEMLEQMVDTYNEDKDSKTNEDISYMKDVITETVIDLINELMDEVEGADWKLAARRGGPDGKIVYFKSKEAKKAAIQKGTHVDVDKKLQAKSGEPTNKPAVKGAELYGAEYDKARAITPKAEPEKPQTQPTEIKSLGDAIMSASKQKGDKKEAFVSKKKDEIKNVLSKMANGGRDITLFSTDQNKQVGINRKNLEGILDKVFAGKELSVIERVDFNRVFKLVTNPDNGDVKIYIAAKNLGKFPQQGYESVKIAQDNVPMGDAIRKYALQAHLNVGKSSEGAIGKKVLTPLKMSSSINPKQPEVVVDIKRTKNGIQIGGKEMKRLKELDENVLIKSLTTKYGPEAAKNKAHLLVLQTKAYNQKLEDLAKIAEQAKGKIPMANFGDVTTPQARTKTTNSILDGVIKRFTTELNTYGETFGKMNVPGLPLNKKVFDTLNKLKELNKKGKLETDEKVRAEYKAGLDQLLLDMANSPDFKDSVADFAEIKAGLQFLAEGKQVYFPASENFQTADIIVMPDEFSVKPKRGQTTEDAIAENLQFYDVTVTYVGGLSVKYKGGGGSANYSKIQQTEYKNPETKNRLLDIQNVYSLAYPKDKSKQLNISDNDIKAANRKIDDTIKWAIKSKILTSEDADIIKKIGAGQAGNTLKGALKDVAKCKGANRKNFEQSIVLHHTMMHLTAVLNNKDVAYTRFSNFNEEVSQNKDGQATKITDDIADGVSKPCYMNPHHNPGFGTSTDEKTGCITGSPTNQNPSHIESEPPKNLLKLKK